MITTNATTLSDIEKWFAMNHSIIFKPETKGVKRIKFECNPWKIIKHQNRVECYHLCAYTGKHIHLVDAYEAGIIGAINYVKNKKV